MGLGVFTDRCVVVVVCVHVIRGVVVYMVTCMWWHMVVVVGMVVLGARLTTDLGLCLRVGLGPGLALGVGMGSCQGAAKVRM